MTKLPEKPSELIRLALSDLEKCEADPNYEIDMYDWHVPAVVVQSLGVERSENPNPHDFKGSTNALFALNSFRSGLIWNGLAWLDIEHPSFPESYPDVDITPYKNDPAAFKSDMRRMADMFEAEGL